MGKHFTPWSSSANLEWKAILEVLNSFHKVIVWQVFVYTTDIVMSVPHQCLIPRSGLHPFWLGYIFIWLDDEFIFALHILVTNRWGIQLDCFFPWLVYLPYFIAPLFIITVWKRGLNIWPLSTSIMYNNLSSTSPWHGGSCLIYDVRPHSLCSNSLSPSNFLDTQGFSFLCT